MITALDPSTSLMQRYMEVYQIKEIEKIVNHDMKHMIALLENVASAVHRTQKNA